MIQDFQRDPIITYGALIVDLYKTKNREDVNRKLTHLIGALVVELELSDRRVVNPELVLTVLKDGWNAAVGARQSQRTEG